MADSTATEPSGPGFRALLALIAICGAVLLYLHAASQLVECSQIAEALRRQPFLVSTQAEADQINQLKQELVTRHDQAVATYGTEWLASWGSCLLGLMFALSSYARGSDAERVFVSYNHENLVAATEIKDRLADQQFHVTLIDWILDVKDDNELKDRLSEHIRSADTVVVLLTPEAMRSRWVGFERFMADANVRRIIYLHDRVSFFSALWHSHFLPNAHASFRIVRTLKARRRYVNFSHPQWPRLVSAHLRGGRSNESGSLPAGFEQLAFSFGSIDQIMLNGLYSVCQNKFILQPDTSWGRFLLWMSRFFQALMIAGPIYFALNFIIEVFLR